MKKPCRPPSIKWMYLLVVFQAVNAAIFPKPFNIGCFIFCVVCTFWCKSMDMDIKRMDEESDEMRDEMRDE